MKNRKRAPGGGRKPSSDPTKVVMVRIPESLLNEVERIAEKNGSNRAVEIRRAITFWARRHRREGIHVEALCAMVGQLATEIERRTGKRWIDDPVTGAAVREEVERLIDHFAPIPPQPLTVPHELKLAGFIITLIEGAAVPPGLPQHIAYEWPGGEYARLFADLGSGWKRNRAVTQGEKK